MLSPHGRRTGVHRRPSGDLSPFGYPHVGLVVNEHEDLAATLAEAWAVELLDEPVDHGIIVPFILWEPKDEPARVPAILTASLAERSPAAEAGRAFAEAVIKATTDLDVLFVASVNGSPGLSPRAPLTEIEGARELEEAFLAALRSDAAEVEGVARALAERAGSCGLGPLTAFACLCAGRSSEVLAHEEPVGVGYTVALSNA